MVKKFDNVTEMAKQALSMRDTLNAAEIVQQNTIDVDTMTEIYLHATFEQRHEMFMEIFSNHGADGLDMLKDIHEKATARVLGRGV